MVKRRTERHLRNVFHWSPDARVETGDVLAAAFGMAGPVLVGLLSGHKSAGFAAALGGLAVGPVESGINVRDHVRREIKALTPAVLAAVVVTGLSVGGGNLAAIGLVATVMVAAVIGGFSRPMAVASTRFIIFLMIVGGMATPSFHEGIGLLIMIVLGAAWTSALALSFTALSRRHVCQSPEIAPPRSPSAMQKLRHWLHSMKRWTKWNYPLRLGACLLIAVLIQRGWPHHHFHWIGLTVALLTSRRSESNAVRTTQRTLGTAVGVLIAGLVLRSSLSVSTLVALIGVLAGARTHFRSRNYLAYSAAMTPLVVLVIDAGGPPGAALLSDRLLATMIGGLLVTLSDTAFRPCVSKG